jgi:membrane protein DedA with SNARE-associated domain
MNEILNLLVRHGIAILFAVEFIEQVGIPLPAAPWLLVAGSLIGVGKMNWWMALSAAALGSLLGDLIWFFLGRYYGNRVLGLLCRISLEPDSCARRTQNLFTRYGMPGLIVAKFIPGLGTLAPPLAGNSGVTTARFIFFDGLSSVLHGGCFILVGRSLQPSTGANHQRAGRSWPQCLRRARRVGGSLHRLQIYSAASVVERAAHGTDHRGGALSKTGVG